MIKHILISCMYKSWFFLAVFALSLSHIARYAPSFQDENISKTTKIYTIH